MSANDQQHRLRSVEEYGRTYVKQYLAKARERHDAIRSDPLQALEFLHSKLFMREDEMQFRPRSGTRQLLPFNATRLLKRLT